MASAAQLHPRHRIHVCRFVRPLIWYSPRASRAPVHALGLGSASSGEAESTLDVGLELAEVSVNGLAPRLAQNGIGWGLVLIEVFRLQLDRAGQGQVRTASRRSALHRTTVHRMGVTRADLRCTERWGWQSPQLRQDFLPLRIGGCGPELLQEVVPPAIAGYFRLTS
jgi:hypothetical protein